MSVNNLPKPGINFKATLGPGSFKRKLSSATRYGNYKNLNDNQKAIVDTIKNPTIQRAIRRGGLSRLQQRSAWFKMRAKDKTITKEDRREIKELLKYLGRGATVANKPSSKIDGSIEVRSGERPIFKAGKCVNGKIITFAGKKVFLSQKKIDANLARNKQIDDSYFTGGEVKKSIIFAGEVGKTYKSGVKGSAPDLGLNKAEVGFAANYNNKNLSNNSSPKTSLGGEKPLGL
jgi:hypothetical protein